VEEEDFFRPSEKPNGDEYEGFCNMGQGGYGGRDWLITAGDLLRRERKTGVAYLFRQRDLLRV